MLSGFRFADAAITVDISSPFSPLMIIFTPMPLYDIAAVIEMPLLHAYAPPLRR